MISSTFKTFSVFFLTLLGNALSAGPVAYTEDGYSMQAPQELIDRVEHIAQQMKFNDEYEVVVPKKPGVQINPWNKFITASINPGTKHPFVLINQEWLNSQPQDEQEFWLTRSVVRMQQGVTPLSVTMLPYLYALISVLLMLLVLFALGRTALATKPLWIRIVMALAFVVASELAFMDKMYAQLLSHLSSKHDTYINELVIMHTGNRDAAVRALGHLNTDINHAFTEGEIFFSPYTRLFANLAESTRLPIRTLN